MSEIQPIVMPKWGLAMEEGTLTGWLVQDGAEVKKGQEIAEIETTKIANVFESPATGTVRRLVANPGDVLAVGALIAVVAPASVSDADLDAFVASFVVAPPADDGAGAIAERKVESNGKSTAFKAAGTESEAIPVVLIHGFGGDSDNWLFNIEELAKDRPVYAIDLPGHGKSTKAPIDGDLDDLMGSVVSLLDQIGAKKAHLVGHSLGAAVAFQTLANHPDRVASVAGIAPAGLGPDVNGQFIEAFIAAEKRKDVKSALQHLFANPDLVSAQMIEGVQRFKRLEGAREALRAIADKNLASGKQAASFRDLAGRSKVPIVIVWGERDAVLDSAAASGLPASVETLLLPNVGHMPHMEAASAVNERLVRHFDAADRK